jgi:hypothetical protein
MFGKDFSMRSNLSSKDMLLEIVFAGPNLTPHADPILTPYLS